MVTERAGAVIQNHGKSVAHPGQCFENCALQAVGLAVDSFVPRVVPIAPLRNIEHGERPRLAFKLLQVVPLQNL